MAKEQKQETKSMDEVITKIEGMVGQFIENLDKKPFTTLIKVMIAVWIIKAIIDMVRSK